MFAHLHLHSNYTFLQALPSTAQICQALKAMGAPGAALTDSASVTGLVEWFDLMEKAGMKAVIGTELWTAEDPGPDHDSDRPLPGHQVVLLARNLEGYQNLCRVVSKAHRARNFAPRTTVSDLREHAGGLLLLTGSRWGAFRDPGLAEKRLDDLVEAMSGRVWVEVCDTGLDEDEPRNQLARSLARARSLPVVATNDVRHLEQEDCAVLETVYRIACGDPPGEEGAWIQTDQAWLKTQAQMAELFPREELEESVRILESCSFSPARGKPMLPRVSVQGGDRAAEWTSAARQFPPPGVFPPPPEDDDQDGPVVDRWFRWYARAGLAVRLSEHSEALGFATEQEYLDRLEWELSVIVDMEYATYHLIVADFINWAKDHGISVGPGRGSAAGSLACWAMRITDCNPLQHGLLFERFLNPERRGLPDIDVDFEQQRRDEVVAYVRSKYGTDRVGQILTVGRMKAKQAIKDVARVLGVHILEAQEWSDRIPDGPKVKLKTSLGDPKLASARSCSTVFRHVSDLALRLEGIPRQFGVHAAGVVVASDPLEDYCPLHYDPKEGRTCVGLDMGSAEKVGLVKFDFLGLKTLDVVEMARRSIEARTGAKPDVLDGLLDDPEVFRLASSADTLGLFQIESGGMINLIRKMKPDRFDDLVAILALFRPGPLQSGMVEDYVERKHGQQEVRYIHDLLKDVLEPTYGILVYQEQIMQTARVLAGYSLGEADLLRRAMGKKKPEEMAQQQDVFVRGCQQNNISESEAKRVFALIDHFSGYGFNKCVSGNTLVHRAGANSAQGSTLTVTELFKVQHEASSYGKKFRAGRLRLLQLNPDGSIRPGRVRAVHWNGVRETFLVSTIGGRQIRATANHRLLTQRGYVRVDELVESDSLVVMTSKEEWPSRKQSRDQAAPKYRGHGTTYGGRGFPEGPESPTWVDGRSAVLHSAQRTVMERSGGRCEECNRTDCTRPEIAHLQDLDQFDGNLVAYNSVDNLRFLCNSCHKKLDYAKGERVPAWTRGRPSGLDQLAKLPESFGEESVYDVEMFDPHHNFVANEIVSHNSHSAAYALITYQTAKLKAHYRADYMAAAMTFDSGNHDQLRAYVSDTRRAGILVLPPDVNRSSTHFTVEGDPPAVRYGLQGVKGLGDSALRGLLQERSARGPYQSLSDLRERTGLGKNVLEALVWSGATDSLQADRAEAAWTIARKPRDLSKRVAPNQIGLFSGRTAQEEHLERTEREDRQSMPDPPSFAERMAREAEALGTILSDHPLRRFRDVVKRIRTHPIRSVHAVRSGTAVTVAGHVESLVRARSRSDDEYVRIVLEDGDASVDVILRGGIVSRTEEFVRVGACVKVEGTVDAGNDQIIVQATQVEPLAQVRTRVSRMLEIDLEPQVMPRIEALASLLEERKSTSGSTVRIRFLGRDGVRLAELDYRVDLQESDLDRIERITGRPDSVHLPGGQA